MLEQSLNRHLGSSRSCMEAYQTRLWIGNWVWRLMKPLSIRTRPSCPPALIPGPEDSSRSDVHATAWVWGPDFNKEEKGPSKRSEELRDSTVVQSGGNESNNAKAPNGVGVNYFLSKVR